MKEGKICMLNVSKNTVITINSTDEERNSILKNKTVKIIPCTETIDLPISRNKYTKSLLRAAELGGVFDVKVKIKYFDKLLDISRSTIKESGEKGFDFAPYEASRDMMTILPELIENAELIHVEAYRHPSGKREHVLEEFFYICGFEKESNVYPVEMLVEKHIASEENRIYFIVSMEAIKKETLPTSGRQYKTEKHRLPGSCLPYEVNISDVVCTFNREHSFLLKHFPAEMLSENQRRLKYRAIRKDLEIRGANINAFDNLSDKENIEIVFPPNMGNEEVQEIRKRLLK